jgi:hypothetical protein
MTFDNVWREVKILPDTAIVQVPAILSERTKKKLAKLTPEEVGQIISEAIEDVNHGSVLPLDVLIHRRL